MEITLFDPQIHQKDSFSSGNAPLDSYIHRLASQDVRRNLTKVFVAHEADQPSIIGYYTLSSFSFSKAELSNEYAQKLPNYPIPAILIGRLAVTKDYQKRGVGAYLLIDALLRVHGASLTTVGIFGVMVEAKGAEVVNFYKHHGFIPFKNQATRLLLPTKTIQDLYVANDPFGYKTLGVAG